MELVRIILSCLLLVLSDALNVSKEEFLAMEEYLKFLNRPAILSIHTQYGDIFDCVDINKQPAFDHPSLIDHKIQMRPSSFPKEAEVEDAQMVTNLTLGLPGRGCPNGTIPIRRTYIEDLQRAKSLSNFGQKHTKEIDDEYDVDLSMHHWAFIHNKYSGKFSGTEVWMNVWSPETANKVQFSLAQFWIMAGYDTEFNTIEGGWTVYANLYGDKHPRLFVFWTADNYVKTGCYNLFCPGFVQVSQKIAPGMVMSSISTYNGPQYEAKFLVMKDQGTGNWWLTIGSEAVGYWPKAIFTHLQGSAEFVQWGGEVYRGGTSDAWPPMGSGHFAAEGYSKASYMRQIKLVDSDNNLTPLPLDAVQFASKPCYSIEDAGETNGRIFYFGGPGGQKC